MAKFFSCLSCKIWIVTVPDVINRIADKGNDFFFPKFLVLQGFRTRQYEHHCQWKFLGIQPKYNKIEIVIKRKMVVNAVMFSQQIAFDAIPK